MSRRADTALTLLAATACLAAPALILAGAHGPLRVVATLVVLALAPGAAVLGGGARREFALVLVTSLAVCVVAAEALLALGAWDPRWATVGLALASLPPLVIRLGPRVRIRRSSESEL